MGRAAAAVRFRALRSPDACRSDRRRDAGRALRPRRARMRRRAGRGRCGDRPRARGRPARRGGCSTSGSRVRSGVPVGLARHRLGVSLRRPRGALAGLRAARSRTPRSSPPRSRRPPRRRCCSPSTRPPQSAALATQCHQAPLVEAMEGFGVLRAAALAGVAAVEVRAISNALGEEDRSRWDVAGALRRASVLRCRPCSRPWRTWPPRAPAEPSRSYRWRVSSTRSRERRPLPPPLPPVSRTVGQVVAQAIELYQRNFFRALVLGLPVAVVDELMLGADLSHAGRSAVLLAASPSFSLAYAGACAIRQGENDHSLRCGSRPSGSASSRSCRPPCLLVVRPPRRALAWPRRACGAGRDGRAPSAGRRAPPHLRARSRGLRPCRRLVRDARDPVRADATGARAAALQPGRRDGAGGDLPRRPSLSPLLFLGAAIVYVDQAARVGLSREERRRLRLGLTGQAK